MTLNGVQLFGDDAALTDTTIRLAKCSNCHGLTMWYLETQVFPDTGLGPPPHEDMPEDVRSLYEEAQSISQKSPRAAVALLRLATETLVLKLLGKKSGNLSNLIGDLKARGLPEKVCNAMDALRVAGGKAIHPGHIVLNEAIQPTPLFKLLNIIVERLIASEQLVDDLFKSIPTTKRDSIKQRDAKKTRT